MYSVYKSNFAAPRHQLLKQSAVSFGIQEGVVKCINVLK